LTDEDKRKDMLARSKGTLRQFALNSDGSEPESTWNKFDELYVSVQRDMGEIPEPLERPQGMDVEAGNNNLQQDQVELATQDTDLTKFGTPIDDDDGKVPSGVPTIVYILGAVILGLGGAAGMYFLLKPRKRTRRHIPGRDEEAPVTIGLPGAEQPAAGQTVARPQPKPKPAPQPVAETTSTSVSEQPAKKKKSVADLTPEEKAALKKKLLAQKRAAAQAKKSEES
jgi:hypothetical protein